jgi:hypothetical protein
MSLQVLWSVLGGFLLVAIGVAVQRRREAARTAMLRRTWGLFRDRERPQTAIASYFRARADGRDPSTFLDDRTWNDLNMDDVFSVLDRTESRVGQQLLYARLRSAPLGDQLEAFEALVTRMSDDQAARERVQRALQRLSSPDAYELAGLTGPGVLQDARWHVVFPVLGVGMAGLVVLTLFWPPALLLIIIGTVGNLILRGTIAPRLRVVAGAFRQVAPLLSAGATLRTLSAADVAPIIGALDVDLPRLAKLKRIASWAGRDSTGAAAGDLGGLVVEYLNLLFCLDANALFFGARELEARGPELLRVLAVVGEVDAALSIASYRNTAPGWTRPVFLTAGGALSLVGIRHPLLPDAVPNSVALQPPSGMIITGSNMSGKSTFLRTMGVTVVLAQTVNTCVAEAYQAPPLVVRSCIGLSDDPAAGKSYYIVEVESVLRLVRASRTGVAHLMLFDELFRGTNTTERLAAGEAVLRSLLASDPSGLPALHVVLAATHDRELVDLLEGAYAAHHFADRVDRDELVFDYQLRPGPATTRNAIALLGFRGAPPGLVAHALVRARMLDDARTGRHR